MPFGPDVVLRTTTDDRSIAGAKVVAGYGREPWLAIRDLSKLAKITARDDAADGDRFEVIGVTLTAGPVPDNTTTQKGATAPGWVAYGTLVKHSPADDAAAPKRRAG
jgi:hypothetical protein